MKPTELPTQQYLRQILDYNPKTGALTWKRREDVNASWNTMFANKPAFITVEQRGYLVGRIKSRSFKAHRVIWKMVHGVDPIVIDHINGDRTDNRIENLRSVARHENSRNAGLPKSNASGVIGVRWNKARSKWVANIRHSGKQCHIGIFKDFHEAVSARKSAEREYGYHPNHGRAKLEQSNG